MRVAALIGAANQSGATWTLEAPKGAWIWSISSFVALRRLDRVYTCIWDMCAYGSAHKRPSQLLSNSKCFAQLRRRCPGPGAGHNHRSSSLRANETKVRGLRKSAPSAFPAQFCGAMSRVVQDDIFRHKTTLDGEEMTKAEEPTICNSDRRVDIEVVRKLEYDMVYIGRGCGRLGLPRSKWHNPFNLRDCSGRDQCLTRFRCYFLAAPDLLAALPELRGKRLACHCRRSERCHADILIQVEAAMSGPAAAFSRFFDMRATDRKRQVGTEPLECASAPRCCTRGVGSWPPDQERHRRLALAVRDGAWRCNLPGGVSSASSFWSSASVKCSSSAVGHMS